VPIRARRSPLSRSLTGRSLACCRSSARRVPGITTGEQTASTRRSSRNPPTRSKAAAASAPGGTTDADGGLAAAANHGSVPDPLTCSKAAAASADLPHPIDVPEHQMAPTQKTGASSAVSPATGGSVPPSSSESGASLPSASGHTSAGNSALKALRQELAREPRQDLVRKNAFPDADKKSAAPQTATFEILKSYWCAPFPPPPVVAGFAARAALRWVAGLLI
jgi:hypothetical protein